MRNYKTAYSIIDGSEVKAWECQIEEGTFQLPGDSTFEKPLEEKEGYNVVWQNGEWSYEEIIVEESEELTLQEAIDEKDLELQTQRDTYCTEEHKRLGTELICSTDADGNLEYDDSGNVIMKEGSLVYFIFSSSDQINTLAKPAVILDSVTQKNSEENYMMEYINYVCNIEDSSEESGFRKGFIKLTPEIALEILEHLIQRNNNYYTRCSNLREKIKDVSSIEELDNFNLN